MGPHHSLATLVPGEGTPQRFQRPSSTHSRKKKPRSATRALSQ